MKTKLLSILAAALLISGISSHKASANDGQFFGTIIGAATGGFIGSNIGSGDGRLAATAAGTLIGAIIGNEVGSASNRDYGYRTVHRPVHKAPVVYRPVYAEPRRAPYPSHGRKVIVHKKTVIVKHVRDDQDYEARKHHWKKKQWKKRRWEKRRRQLARECYEHPRRCAQAF